MRISKKDLERLKCVESELDKCNPRLAKVVHNVLQESKPEFIYILQESGNWNYEFTSSYIEVFASFTDAVNKYKQLIKTAQCDMREWTDEAKIQESEQIDEDAESAEFTIYEDNNRAELHDTITITRKEIG